MATNKERCPLDFKNGMMVAGRSVKDPSKVLYVGYVPMKNTIGKAYFFDDARKDDITKQAVMKDLDIDTIPQKIFVQLKYKRTGQDFSQAAQPLWKAYVDEEAEQAALRTARAAASVGQRRTSTKEDNNVDLTNLAPATTTPNEISGNQETLSIAMATHLLKLYNDINKSLNSADLDLIADAIGQLHPASYKPPVELLGFLRDDAIKNNWVPSKHPLFPNVDAVSDADHDQERSSNTGRNKRKR